jgi:predicted PurR-regulated permease PerM
MDGPPTTPATSSGLRTSPILRPLRPLILFGSVVLVTASLSWARAVLIPIALATLLTFLLDPVTSALQRWRLGRATSVLVVVVLAFSLIAGAGWALSQQVATLSDEVPKYTAAVKEKVSRWRHDGGGRFLGRVSSSVDEVVGELGKAVPAREKPVPVVIEGGRRSLLAWATAVTEPLATIGFVALLVVFMLLERAELRNRLIRLVGYGRMTLTTRALDEAGERISSYLVGQSLVNTSIGGAVAVGLVLLGVPYALLWGVLLAVLRFVPYVGVWLAVVPPVLLSLAAFDGWAKPLSVAALFLGVDLLVSSVIEPIVYSQRAGVSKVALLVAIAFWTWLWGPVGLLLATPLTACLLVLSKYIPEMNFVAVLLGDAPALAPPAAYYQRLLAEDHDEAAEIVETFLQNQAADQLYDGLLVPALVCAKRDIARQRLSDDGLEYVARATLEIVENVAPREEVAADGPRVRVLGCPARDRADEVALGLFGRLLDPRRFDVELMSAHVLASELIARVETSSAAVICLASLPPGGLAQARYFCKRLRARCPDVKILVGRWGEDDAAAAWEGLRSAGADHVAGTLLESRDQLDQVASLDRPVTAAA